MDVFFVFVVSFSLKIYLFKLVRLQSFDLHWDNVVDHRFNWLRVNLNLLFTSTNYFFLEGLGKGRQNTLFFFFFIRLSS